MWLSMNSRLRGSRAVNDVPELEPYFTTKEVAKSLKTTDKTVREWARKEKQLDPSAIFTWGKPETMFKKAYTNVRIPQSTFLRWRKQGGPPQ